MIASDSTKQLAEEVPQLVWSSQQNQYRSSQTSISLVKTDHLPREVEVDVVSVVTIEVSAFSRMSSYTSTRANCMSHDVFTNLEDVRKNARGTTMRLVRSRT